MDFNIIAYQEISYHPRFSFFSSLQKSSILNIKNYFEFIKRILFKVLFVLWFAIGGFLIAFCTCHNIHSQWIQTNGPYGGHVLGLGSSGSRMYAGILYGGLYISTDLGQNWSSAPFTNPYIMCFASNATDIYAGIAFDSGVYRSTNFGQSWVQTGLNNEGILSLALKDTIILAGTDGPGSVYISTNKGQNWTQTLTNKAFISSLITDNSYVFAGTAFGVLISSNNGFNWVQSNLEEFPILSLDSRDNFVFAGTYFNGIYVSTDYGGTWTQTPLNNQEIDALIINGNNVYAGNSYGVYVSTNNGQSWYLTSLGNIFVNRLISIDNHIFAGTAGYGVYSSTNAGQNWSWMSGGMRGLIVKSFANGKLNNENYDIFVGAGGIHFSSDNGQNWVRSTFTNYGGSPSIAAEGDYIVAAGTGLYRSTNYGNSWTLILNSQYFSVESVALNANYSFLGVSDGIFKSSNLGENWYRVLTGPQVNTITIGAANVYAGTTSGVYISSNSGENWYQTTLNNNSVYSIGVNGTSIFAGTESNGIFLSTDNCESWAQTSFINLFVNSLAVSDSGIFAGTDSSGVYFSSDFGQTWAEVNQGLGNHRVRGLKIANGFIFAGTEGSSVWKRPLSELIGIRPLTNKVPSKYELFQNYPNPFNPQTKIKYDLPKEGFVILKIYDLIGKEIYSTNEYKLPGTYEFTFDGSKYASGVYFYRIETRDFTAVKKMVLIK